MSRFEELARIKELALELAELKGMRFLPTAEIDRMGEIEEEICCSADMLLQIAEAFQPGDAERLALLVLNEQQRWTDDRWQAAIDCLRRLQAAAEAMER